MTNKYQQLDRAIMQEIDLENKAGSRSTLKDLLACDRVAKKMEPHTTEKTSWPQRPAFRILDARLQALRKSGEIIYIPADKENKAGWSVAANTQQK